MEAWIYIFHPKGPIAETSMTIQILIINHNMFVAFLHKHVVLFPNTQTNQI